MSDQNLEERDAQSATRRRRRLRVWLMTALAVVFIGAGTAYGAYWYLVARYWVSTDDAYVHGNQVALMSQVNGTVTAVDADDTDLVHQGQVLVSLDHSDARVALGHAEAQLAQTVRKVRQLYEQEAEQQAVIAERRTALKQSHDDYLRDKRLVASHSVSQQAFQHSQTQWQTAQAQLQQAERRLAALQTQTAGTDLRHQPDVRLAIAAVRSAYLHLKRTTIVAPVTGYVAKRTVQVGQQVQPGNPLMAVVPLGQIWIEANFKETELGHMRIGQPVTINSDFYGSGVTFHGHVTGISPGTGSVFELLPPQNATGNWIKVVQRVPVRIALQASELKKHPLRLGLSMHVAVNVRDTRGKALSQRPVSKPLYRTGVYRRQLDGLQTLIDHIIEANGGGKPPSGKTDHGR